ncbi:hypothetical protein EV421DRAFT_1893411 [Armillaria borealis]|uniref:Helitron helicase-like domain-containing protein n=1 Tax=Armillaria borealis TaxID=47425 RepID=A0AA39IVB3_9AGAR|nr:hypothetical protein EV421DRAFT_1893411 [Armillaria borealis]
MPEHALARGTWLGEVPPVLQDLTFMEKMLIARMRHTCAFVQISTGMRKMKANVIAFENPTPKIYDILPPPIEDIQEVMAILFTGPAKPTLDDFKRTPVLVRRNPVFKALNWLRLNHDMPPVSVEYKERLTNKTPKGISDGVEDGECPFIDLETMTSTAMKSRVLAVGQSAHSKSIWNNPHLYPKLFPWLFPYGKGGIGDTMFSDDKHKRLLMMYHDKRFQRDPTFAFVAFSHIQVKASTSGTFLLADRKNFQAITQWLMNVNQSHIACYQIIRDLDHVAGKYMNNEIWSLIADKGAPSWYITLSPVDNQHPLDKHFIEIPLLDHKQRQSAAAWFFNFLVNLFIEEFLGCFYGNTSGYYGTVEQQGALSPQETKIINWLEACHTGDFFLDSKQEVWAAVDERSKNGDYVDPTLKLPAPPPPCCTAVHDNCPKCDDTKHWENEFRAEVDDLVICSNVHDCERARFPRKLYSTTEVDVDSGSLNIKKQLTYVMRCNTDVTSLSSGTAIKAIVLYISNYITKSSLKTHVVFDVICDIFAKSTDVLQSHLPEKEKARRLIGKIVNLLAVKLELRAPMLAMYLLGHPDHYTDHKFIPLYWTNFVNEVRKFWTPSNEDSEGSDNMIIVRQGGELHGFSPVMDYTLCNRELDHLCLYDWVHLCKQVQKCKSKKARDADTISNDYTNNRDDDAQEDMPTHKIPKNRYFFLDEHPFKKTHYLQKRKENEYLILNFVGGTLPRRDGGDREYYCCTMLTLFKPWRSSADLKESVQNWHEAFESYAFSS